MAIVSSRPLELFACVLPSLVLLQLSPWIFLFYYVFFSLWLKVDGEEALHLLTSV